MRTTRFAPLAVCFLAPLVFCGSAKAQVADGPFGPLGDLGGSTNTGAGTFDLRSRNLSRSVTDLRVPGAVLPFTFTRTFSSRGASSETGVWRNNWLYSLVEVWNYSEQGGSPGHLFDGFTLTLPDGRSFRFAKPTLYADPGTPGTYTAAGSDGLQVFSTPGNNPVWINASFRDRDGSLIWFNYNGVSWNVASVTDAQGRTVTFSYNSQNSEITVTEPGGRWIRFNVGLGTPGSIVSRTQAGVGSTVLQTVSYGANTVTYDDVIDPSTGSPIQAVYAYQGSALIHVGPIGADYWAGCAQMYWASDPMFNGPLKKVRLGYYPFEYAYWDRSSGPRVIGSPNQDIVNSVGWSATSSTQDAGVSIVTYNIPSNVLPDFYKRIEVRADGRTRTFSFATDAGVEDFSVNNHTDYFNDPAKRTFYKSAVYGAMTEIKDARGYVTTQTAEPKYANITSRTNPDTSTASLTFTDLNNPFWVASKTDVLGNTTTFTRDPVTKQVTRVDHPGGTYELFTYNSFGQVLTHRLPNGFSETNAYDARGLLTSHTDAAGDVTTYTYDSLDRVATVKNAFAAQRGLSFSAKFTYNGRHQITSVEYPSTGGVANPKVIYAYDAWTGYCTGITDELGHTKTFTYDDYGRITYYTESVNAPDWKGTGNVPSRTWRWTYERVRNGVVYDASKHISNVWRTFWSPPYKSDGDQHVILREFDPNDRVILETTGLSYNAGTNQWTWGTGSGTSNYTYDAVGNKITSVDQKGRTTTFTYDNRNRVFTVTDPLSQVTTTLYDYAGNKTKVTFPDTKFQQWSGYDAFGQPSTFTDERGNITNLSYLYGPMKKLYTVTTHRDKDAGGTEDQLTTFSYDNTGRQTAIAFPDGTNETTTYTYGLVTSYKTRKNAARASNWATDFDARGRETKHTWSDDTGTAGTPSESRTWDDAGRLLTLSNRHATLTYAYDDAGQVLSEIQATANPLGGTAPAPAVISYYRYPDGGVAHLLGLNGYRIRHDYNAHNQLTAVGQSDASGNWLGQYAAYAYQPDGKLGTTSHGNGLVTSYGYDGKGNVNLMSLGAASSAFTFLPNTTVLVTGQSLTIPYSQYVLTLQSNNNLTLTENGVLKWQTSTSGKGLWQLVMQGDGNLVLYNESWVAKWNSATGGNNNATLTFGTDGNLVLKSTSGAVLWSSNTATTVAALNLAVRTYYRDNRDRITAWTKGPDASHNPMENGRGDKYTYDAEGQLTDALYLAQTPNGTATGWLREEHFQWDQLGNRKYVARNSTTWQQWTRRDNGLNQIKDTPPTAGAVKYEDNASPAQLNNGNLVTDGNTIATFNALNRPEKMRSSARATDLNFAYDPLGRCVSRSDSSSTTYLYYDGWNLIQERVGAATTTSREYVHGGRVDEIVHSYVMSSGAEAYHHYDARTHCIMLTDQNKSIREQYDYDAFGRVYTYDGAGNALWVNTSYRGSPFGNRFLFTGREWIWDIGVYDYRHRQYNPELGRFLQPDLMHFAGKDYNIYRYCHNDPINKHDADGLWPTEIHERIIDRATGGTTLTSSAINQLKVASRQADSFLGGGQHPSASFKHAMSAPGQSKSDAAAQYKQFTAERLTTAVALQRQWASEGKSGYNPRAMAALGEGLHAVTDNTSPMHSGFQVWHGLGNPLTKKGFSKDLDAMVHAAGEKKQSGEAEYNSVKDAYEYIQRFQTSVGSR